jgi:hypothetical protein
VAVKLAWTLSPLAMVQVLVRMNVTLVVVLLPPLNPDWRQADDVKSTRAPLVGALPSAADGVTVMEPPLANAAVAVKLTVKLTLAALWTVLTGVTLTALTPPVGDPMVKLLDVTDAADAGSAVTAVKVPKDPMATAKLPATSLAPRHRRPDDLGKACCLCI